MATATLQFDLNDPDDVRAHLRAVKSLDMALAIWEITYNLRKKTYYEIEEREIRNKENNTNEPVDGVEILMEKIFEVLEEHGINTDELIN